MRTNGQIGELVENVLETVRGNMLTKLAEHEIVRELEAQPKFNTDLGKALHKLATDLRQGSADVSLADLTAFVTEVSRG